MVLLSRIRSGHQSRLTPRSSQTRGFATVASLYRKEDDTPDEIAGREV